MARLAFLLALFLTLLACRKEGDKDPPRVRILDPGPAYTFQVPDTLLVRVEVSDERSVGTVTFALTDANGVPVAPLVTAPVNSANAALTRAIPVTSERIAGGAYTVTVVATDGTNEARAFREVQVQPAPLRLRSILVAAAGSGPPPYPIWRIDSTNTLSNAGELSELGGAAIDPDRTYFSGTLTQPLQAWPNITGQSIWTIPNLGAAGSTLPFFTSLCVDPGDGLCYVSMEDGRVQGRNAGGAVLFSGVTPVELRSRHTVVAGNRLVSLAQDRVLGTWHMLVHARPSGEFLARYPLDLAPIGAVAKSGTEVVVIGSRNGNGILQLRNVEQGGGSDIAVFNEGPIAAFARSGAGGLFLAVEDRILRYSLSSSSPTVLVQGLSASTLAYSEASGAVYAAEGGTLWAIDPTTGSRSVLRSLPRPIGHILPLANR